MMSTVQDYGRAARSFLTDRAIVRLDGKNGFACGYLMGLVMMYMALTQYTHISQHIFALAQSGDYVIVKSNETHKLPFSWIQNDTNMPLSPKASLREMVNIQNTLTRQMQGERVEPYISKQRVILTMLTLTKEFFSNKIIQLMKSDNRGHFVLPESTKLDPLICISIPKSTACASAVAWSYTPILGNGCVKIFLDVGSNIGMHSRFLFEPNLYQPRHRYDNIFDSEFGVDRTQNKEEMCVVAFEPNPRHRKRHQQLATAYARQGWKYRAFYAAVGGSTWQLSSDNKLAFYVNDKGNNDWGFSIENKKRGHTKKVRVPILDLSRFVQEHIGRAAVRRDPREF